MKLTTAQRQIFDCPKRFRVVSAGRRFGKTFLSVWEIAKVARFPKKKIFYVAPSYRMAKQILWEELKEQLTIRRWVKSINETDLSVILVNGTKISLRSADNYDSMRGVSLDFVVFDEAAYMDFQVWTEVIRPALSDRQGSALFISTPKSLNWFKDVYDNGIRGDIDWASFQFTTLDGGNVPREEIEAAKRDLDEKTFRQEYEASFETYSGVVYYSFANDNVNKVEINEIKQIYLGIDFNVNPMSCVVAIPVDNGLQVIDEIIIYGSNTEELVQEVRNRYPTQKVFAFPDPAGVQRKTSANGKTDISILENAGFIVRYKRQHPAVRDRINAVNSLLCNSKKERRLKIGNAKNLIKALQRHTYKENTLIPNKDDGFDHITDALGYMVEYLYPVTKEITTQPTTVWGAQ